MSARFIFYILAIAGIIINICAFRLPWCPKKDILLWLSVSLGIFYYFTIDNFTIEYSDESYLGAFLYYITAFLPSLIILLIHGKSIKK